MGFIIFITKLLFFKFLIRELDDMISQNLPHYLTNNHLKNTLKAEINNFKILLHLKWTQWQLTKPLT